MTRTQSGGHATCFSLHCQTKIQAHSFTRDVWSHWTVDFSLILSFLAFKQSKRVDACCELATRKLSLLTMSVCLSVRLSNGPSVCQVSRLSVRLPVIRADLCAFPSSPSWRCLSAAWSRPMPWPFWLSGEAGSPPQPCPPPAPLLVLRSGQQHSQG